MQLEMTGTKAIAFGGSIELHIEHPSEQRHGTMLANLCNLFGSEPLRAQGLP